MSTPTHEPVEFYAADTVEWTKSLSEYPANEGWALTYSLRGPKSYTLTTTASGSEFSVSISATATRSYPPGDYWLFGFASKDGKRYEVYRGRLKVLPDPLSASGTYDGRSHAERMLAAIESTLENRASREEKSYTVTVDGQERSLELLEPSELVRLHSRYSSIVEQEKKSERIRAGLKGGGRILTRFVRS